MDMKPVLWHRLTNDITCWTPWSVYTAQATDRVRELVGYSTCNVCAILEDGRVECWETYGNHARPSWPEGMPRDLGPVQKLVFRSWGDAGCAVLETGALKCWGHAQRWVPADLGPVKDVSLGSNFICALRVDDTVISFQTQR